MLDNSTQALRDNPQNGIVAIDYAEPHLEGDIYLYLLTDILRESLPKTRVYQFVDRVNQVMPYVVSLYQMGDSNYRKQDLKETLKIHNPTKLNVGGGGHSRNTTGIGNTRTLDLGLNVQRTNRKQGPPENVKHTVSRQTMKAIQDPRQRKALLLKQFKK